MAEKLRIGIVGCGNVGAGLHLSAWQADPDLAEVVGLADPTPAALTSAGAAAGLSETRLHSDAAELLARDDIDAVDICTPQHLRREILSEAARAGKHILCEKPIAAVPSDAADAVAAAAEHGVVLAMVHNYLWLPEIQAAARVLASGEIGDVRVVIINFLGVVDVPGIASYAADWRKDPSRSGGGVLIDMLHGVYLVEELLGANIERASAYIDSSDHRAAVEDLALCRYETSVNAGLVNIGWGLGPGGIEVIGSEGRISVRYENGGTAPWAPLEHVRVTTAAGVRAELGGDTAALERHGMARSFQHTVADFCEAILQGRPPRATGADGLRVLEATVAAYESGARGVLVDLPLDPGGPVAREGVLGIRQLPVPDWSPVRSGDLFSVRSG